MSIVLLCLIEFDVDGGTIFLERKRSGNRLLTIVSKNGDTIELTRESRGGKCYCLFLLVVKIKCK